VFGGFSGEPASPVFGGFSGNVGAETMPIDTETMPSDTETADRPVFGGAELSEGFNAFGGMEDIYFDDEVFTAIWQAVYERDGSVAAAHWVYVISFDEEVLHRAGPMIIEEADVPDHTARADGATDWARRVAESLGYSL
ncbi:MAG: hypothetical protein ABGZ36_21750, partial [Actinomycetota bacterium]